MSVLPPFLQHSRGLFRSFATAAAAAARAQTLSAPASQGYARSPYSPQQQQRNTIPRLNGESVRSPYRAKLDRLETPTDVLNWLAKEEGRSQPLDVDDLTAVVERVFVTMKGRTDKKEQVLASDDFQHLLGKLETAIKDARASSLAELAGALTKFRNTALGPLMMAVCHRFLDVQSTEGSLTTVLEAMVGARFDRSMTDEVHQMNAALLGHVREAMSRIRSPRQLVKRLRAVSHLELERGAEAERVDTMREILSAVVGQAHDLYWQEALTLLEGMAETRVYEPQCAAQCRQKLINDLDRLNFAQLSKAILCLSQLHALSIRHLAAFLNEVFVRLPNPPARLKGRGQRRSEDVRFGDLVNVLYAAAMGGRRAARLENLPAAVLSRAGDYLNQPLVLSETVHRLAWSICALQLYTATPYVVSIKQQIGSGQDHDLHHFDNESHTEEGESEGSSAAPEREESSAAERPKHDTALACKVLDDALIYLAKLGPNRTKEELLMMQDITAAYLEEVSVPGAATNFKFPKRRDPDNPERTPVWWRNIGESHDVEERIFINSKLLQNIKLELENRGHALMVKIPVGKKAEPAKRTTEEETQDGQEGDGGVDVATQREAGDEQKPPAGRPDLPDVTRDIRGTEDRPVWFHSVSLGFHQVALYSPALKTAIDIESIKCPVSRVLRSRLLMRKYGEQGLRYIVVDANMWNNPGFFSRGGGDHQDLMDRLLETSSFALTPTQVVSLVQQQRARAAQRRMANWRMRQGGGGAGSYNRRGVRGGEGGGGGGGYRMQQERGGYRGRTTGQQRGVYGQQQGAGNRPLRRGVGVGGGYRGQQQRGRAERY
ncbi:unnamed protein product [Vitrella brassicaformis CCMP3155]|uniref:RAP domain-containing protein n=2 Tax=Vitrella brassicaformis TaxID=1169539 RepID=A0A0G4EQB0_VITBC|nr:unnamed protein product [Vitrella brassicaformis CCMP3155]|eukprot:CEL99641.1 unnamed protein product [Vitrella brassicaformis CCMP3155]